MGFPVDRRTVVLDRPIKTLGLFEVTTLLHPEVSATVIANVARTADEAMIQEATGRAFHRADEEEEEAEEAENVDDGAIDDESVDETAGEDVDDTPLQE